MLLTQHLSHSPVRSGQVQDKIKPHYRSQRAFGSAEGGKAGMGRPQGCADGENGAYSAEGEWSTACLCPGRPHTNSSLALTVTLVIELTINLHLGIVVTLNLDPA